MALLKKTRHNHDQWKSDYEDKYCKDYGKSETVPNQALSITDIIQRHSNGLQVPVDSRLEWLDSDELVPELRDLTDIDEAIAFLDEYQAKIDSERARALEKKAEMEAEKGSPPPEPTE